MRHTTTPIPRSSLIERLVILIALGALAAALAGLLWQTGDGTATITTYRGQRVDLAGSGLYRDSSRFVAAGQRGTDVVTLLVALPLLADGALLHRRGLLRGGLLLAGALAWFLYAYGSLALGTAAYNDLFLLHVTLFAASLWALVLLLTGSNLPALAARLTPGIPRRGPGIFLLASGAVTMLIWLIEPVAALLTRDLPASLGVSTTLFTTALDIGVIVPAAWITGALVLRGRAAGYLCAVPLLVLEALLAPMIVAQTIFQLAAGIDFTIGEIAGPIAGFCVLAVLALTMLFRLFRHIAEGTTEPAGSATAVAPA
jgi:hypothetical protein